MSRGDERDEGADGGPEDPAAEGRLGDVLELPTLRALRRDAPAQLFRHLDELRRSFLFGVEDRRDDEDPEPWGGVVRVTLNQNVVLHFVRGLGPGMPTEDDLPQFAVLPDEDRADAAVEREVEVDGETFKGVTFYVDPNEWDQLVGHALAAHERYEDWEAIPDVWFADGPLVPFVTSVVFEHPVVRAEREYDFRRGLVGGKGPPDDLEEEEDAAPVKFTDEDDEDEEGGEDDEGDGDEVEEGEEGEDDDRHFRTFRL